MPLTECWSNEIITCSRAGLGSLHKRPNFRNAELSAQEHSVAESLQRAVLPEHLPEVDGLVLDATYLPATAGLSVGGDFYDAFQLGRRVVGLVIGDVVGHDIHSASIMGQRETACGCSPRSTPTRRRYSPAPSKRSCACCRTPWPPSSTPCWTSAPENSCSPTPAIPARWS